MRQVRLSSVAEFAACFLYCLTGFMAAAGANCLEDTRPVRIGEDLDSAAELSLYLR